MYCLIVFMVVVNTFLSCLGAPVTNATMLSDTLKNLASNCENKFLTTQLQNKVTQCHLPVPPYHEQQFECLLFYDINKQLCDAVGSAKLSLNQDYSTQINAEQDVSKLCNTAKDWTFTDINEVYRKTVNLVFHDPVRCSKVCSLVNDDILNVDSTFFCKYFKWGSEMLQLQVSLPSAPVNSAPVLSVQGPSSNVGTVKIDEPSTQVKALEVKTDANHVNIPLAKQPEVSDKITDKISTTNIENLENHAQASVLNNVETPTSAKQNDEPAVSENSKKDDVQSVLLPANTATATKEENHPTQKDSHKQETTSNANKNVVDNSKNAVVSDTKKGIANSDLLNQLENPKPKEIGDTDNYQDSDEGRDGLVDTQADDIDDPSLDDLEAKMDPDLNKKPAKSNSASIYGNDIAQKEIYPNTIPDGFSEDDDDHFFPFFLTAIIMVILLYILYHNKSKVSKVFLGLIVEGRQTGRRRNSRGHAYRRLDTLEQAMSANTAAPPSKIIY